MSTHEPGSMESRPPERFLMLVRRERRRRRAVRGAGVACVCALALGVGVWWMSMLGGGARPQEHLAQGSGPSAAQERAPRSAFPRAMDRDERGIEGGAGGPARALPRAGDAARWLRESGDGELCCV